MDYIFLSAAQSRWVFNSSNGFWIDCEYLVKNVLTATGHLGWMLKNFLQYG
jgi:hypothetical protein